LRRTLQGQVEPAFEFAAVDEAGERIVAGLIGQLGDVLAFAADIVEHQDDAGNFSAARTDGCRGLHDGNFGTVIAHQQNGRGCLDRAFFAQHHFDRVRRELAAAFVDHAQDRLHRQPSCRSRRPPGELLRNRIEVFHPAVGIGGDDAVGYGLKGDERALLLGKEVGGGLPAIGHVRDRARHADRLAGRVAHRLAA